MFDSVQSKLTIRITITNVPLIDTLSAASAKKLIYFMENELSISKLAINKTIH